MTIETNTLRKENLSQRATHVSTRDIFSNTDTCLTIRIVLDIITRTLLRKRRETNFILLTAKLSLIKFIETMYTLWRN